MMSNEWARAIQTPRDLLTVIGGTLIGGVVAVLMLATSAATAFAETPVVPSTANTATTTAAAASSAHAIAERFATDATRDDGVALTPTRKTLPKKQTAIKTPTFTKTSETKPPAAPIRKAEAPQPARTDKASAKSVTAEATPAARPSLDYEIDMLKRARVEAAERKVPTTPSTSNATPTPLAQPSTAATAAKPDAVSDQKPPAKSVNRVGGDPALVPLKAPAEVANSAVQPDAKPAPLTTPPATAAKPDATVGVAASAPIVSPNVASTKIAPSSKTDRNPAATAVIPLTKATPVEALPLPTPSRAITVTDKVSDPLTAAIRPKAESRGLSVADAAPEKPAQQPAKINARVSILLVYTTPSTAHDPLACVTDKCFVSSGLTSPAITVGKTSVASMTTTTGLTPDPCRSKSACVYRDVGIGLDDLLHIADLNAGKIDTSRSYAISPDKSCAINDGLLECAETLATPEYRVWIVPEQIAVKAGAAAIEDAVAEGLPEAAPTIAGRADK